MMKITKIAGAVLLMSGTAGVALACDMPPLVAIPPKDAVGDKGPQIQQETTKYFEGMKVYTACVQAELTAAGGDSAPTIMKAVLVQRNNYAVAETQAVLKAYDESVGVAAILTPAAPAAAPETEPKSDSGGRRRGDR
jgi:hypothetical protein